MLNRPTRFAFIFLALTLARCDSLRVKPDANEPVAERKTQSKVVAVKEQVAPKDLIALAQQKKSPERESLFLQAAEQRNCRTNRINYPGFQQYFRVAFAKR